MAPVSQGDVLEVAKIAIENSSRVVNVLAIVLSVITLVFTIAGSFLLSMLNRTRANVEKELAESKKATKDELDKVSTKARMAHDELRVLKTNLEATVELTVVKSYLDYKDFSAAAELCHAIMKEESLDPRLRARAQGSRAFAFKRLERHSEALAEIHACIETLKKAQHDHPIFSKGMLSRALFNAACYCSLTKDYGQSKAFLQESLELLSGASRSAVAQDVWSDADLEGLRMNCGGPGQDLERLAPKRA